MQIVMSQEEFFRSTDAVQKTLTILNLSGIPDFENLTPEALSDATDNVWIEGTDVIFEIPEDQFIRTMESLESKAHILSHSLEVIKHAVGLIFSVIAQLRKELAFKEKPI